ncbi:DUF1161 domain-containing protein [Salinicola sp. RZ23]|uniref:DUF1161 domain-containing protein n=1 Tax=Salinicola sp. RZ23 TaxID=1949087 RepID=UPI000DA16D51|nr:DUF1161 domain-containing protein [Salinicola sp. RZ23]
MRIFTWKFAVVAGLSSISLLSSLAWAQARQSDSPFDQQPEARLACSKLQTQIEQTIRANGARHFLLEIVDNAQVEGGVVRAGEPHAGAEVVGSCDGGTRKIVYSRHGATESSAPTAISTPEAPASDAAAAGSDRPAAGAEPSQAEPSAATMGDTDTTGDESSNAGAADSAVSQPEAPTPETGSAKAEGQPAGDLGRQDADGRVRDTLKPATSP